MRQFRPLTVTSVDHETPDSVRIGFAVAPEFESEFDFLPGQHLPIESEIDGQRVRRTYSLCSQPGEALQIGVRVQPGGKFSEYAANVLAVGDELSAMPPLGQFHANIDPKRARVLAAFAAGSGITPILSIVQATLEKEPESLVVLFYGNRRQQTTMFIDDLYALKNRFPERLQLVFLFSREEQEFPVMGGRLDGGKVAELFASFCARGAPDDVFVCGPDTMIGNVTEALVDLGVDAGVIHTERFGVPRSRSGKQEPPPAVDAGKRVAVTVVMDGHKRRFDMRPEGVSIVDAAADAGIELPYSCKGGVCATCRTHLREGEVRMDANYGLEPWELEQGYILACQSHPLSDAILVDYDRT